MMDYRNPTPDEMAQAVVDLLTAPDERAVIGELAAHGATAGYTMLSLAHIASRRLAYLAREHNARVGTTARQANGGPLPMDDPREFATLLLGASANEDRDGVVDLVGQALGKGPDTAAGVIAVLVAMAHQELAAAFLARQNPHEN